MMFASLLLAAAHSIYESPRLPIRDAVIRADAQDVNSGRDFILTVGAGKILLVDSQGPRFSLPEGQEAATATLTYPIKEGAPKVKSIRLIKRPWQEGKGWQGNGGEPGRGVTWKSAISGSNGARWTSPGVGAQEDSQSIDGWQSEVKGGKLVISGLAASLNQVLRDPSRSFGWRIEVEGEAQLVSAELQEDGPELEVTPRPALGVRQILVGALLKDAAGNSWKATVSNTSSTPQSGLKAVWTQGERVLASQDLTLAGDEVKTLTASVLGRSSHEAPEESLISLRIEGQGGSVGRTCHPWGLSVSASPAAERAVEMMNSWALPFSRFSFAEEGVSERFRLAGPSEKPDITLAEGQSLSPAEAAQRILIAAADWSGAAERAGWGITRDTRDERLGVPGVPLTALGWASRLANDAQDPSSGLLGRYEAGRLNQLVGVRGEARRNWRPALPASLVLRCFDISGKPLSEVDLEVRVISLGLDSLTDPKPKSTFKGKTMNTGGAFLNPASFVPARQALLAGPDEALELILSKGDSSQSIRMSWADLVAEGLRGTTAAASIEVRVPAVDSVVDESSNIAEGKVVEDSLGRFPAQLAALLDGKAETSIEMPGAEGGWIEVDLGRERPVAQIELIFEGAPWKAFNIAFYGTSQSPAGAQNWIQERESSLRVEQGRAVYRGSLTLMRYIRIMPLSGEGAKLSELAVRSGTQVAPPPKPGTSANPPR